MRIYALLAWTSIFIAGILAVFHDEAFHVDYHYALLGTPKPPDTTFFHRPQASSSASLLYTLSERLVLGAVNPKDGSIVWRHRLTDYAPPSASDNGNNNNNSSFGILRAQSGEDVVVSGVGDWVAAWDAMDGKLVWDMALGDGYPVRDMEIVDEGSGVPRVVVLLGHERAAIVRTLDLKSGLVTGEYIDESGDIPFQVSSSPGGIYYISLVSTLLKGLKIRVTSVDLTARQQISHYTLNSDGEITSPESVIFVGANSAAPLIVWTDKARKTLKANVVGSKNVHSLPIQNDAGEDIQKITIHAPRSPIALSHFLVHYEADGHDWAEVYHIDLKTSAISKAYQLPRLGGRGGAFSTSTIDANVYFTRITQSEITLVSSASHGFLGRWEMKQGYDNALHAVSEVVPRGGSEFAVRFGLVADGVWSLVRNGDLIWTRPEDLSGAVAAAWVDYYDQEEVLKHELEIEGHRDIVSAYIHRVKRHVHDIGHFPSWLQSLPEKFLSSFGDSNPSPSFGFGKIVLIGTDTGRVMAIDAAGHGRIMWNYNVFGNLESKPIISAITVDGRHATVYGHDGTILQLDALSGVVLNVFDPVAKTPQGYVLPPGGTTLTVIHPDGSPAPANVPREQSIVVTINADGIAAGWSWGSEPTKIWEFVPSTGHEIVNLVSRPTHDPVASIGKVMGDRSVMYKYLNENLALITSVSTSSGTATFHLLDAISGCILHSVTHWGVDTTLPIPSLISENWFVYSFYSDPQTLQDSKGHRLVVSELYESPLRNDRGPLGSASNFSSFDPSTTAHAPYILSQSFMVPEGISSFSVTQSRQGITTRQLLCTLTTSHSIVGIPRSFLDPRRPVGRDPTPQEAEEGLFRYGPFLDFDGRWYLTHTRDVLGIREVLSTPSMLESTSLVFGFGHDVFGTRVSPSGAFDMLGKGFSKVQLVITVSALSLGVGILSPMVRALPIYLER